MKFKPVLEEGRVLRGDLRSNPGDPYGAFQVRGPCGATLYMIASDGEVPDQSLAGWEHVSVRRNKQVPNWQEMCFVKNLFWAPEECVVQFHPPATQYVNSHPFVLHLWRPSRGQMPMPPAVLVGRPGPVITSGEQARELWIEMNDAIGVKRRDYKKAPAAPAAATKDVSIPPATDCAESALVALLDIIYREEEKR
jgi:hypothetical protein